MPRQRLNRQQQQQQQQQQRGEDPLDSDALTDSSLLDTFSARRDTLYSTESMMEDDQQYLARQEKHGNTRSSYASTATDGDNNSSHHENEHEDDVFSDHSPPSSMGSVSPEADHDKSRWPRLADYDPQDGAQQSPQNQAPQGSHVSSSKVKGSSPRPQPRSSSSGKAPQMSSPPPPSHIAGGTPHSGGRRSAIPTVSRIGSPNPPAQYSPKKTPPRFKKVTPPLVLLHVTLLPLRWAWGDVLNSAQPSELSDEARTLRESWRQLQDRQGDTIQDRGILLPHPQNDFELLEERLLEAMELPLKRRARIMECGHYLGPSNIMSFANDESEGEEESVLYSDEELGDAKPRRKGANKSTHWCDTCVSNIPFDALGPGKVYRVNIYASNGLLKAGAWEACWKEMERVDVELEPIIDSKIQDELLRLADPDKASELDRAAVQRQRRAANDNGRRRNQVDDGDDGFMAQASFRQRISPSRWRGWYGGRSSTGFFQQDRSQSEDRVSAYRSISVPRPVQDAFRFLTKNQKSVGLVILGLLSIVALVSTGAENLSNGGQAVANWGKQMIPRQVIEIFQGGDGSGLLAGAGNRRQGSPCTTIQQTIEKVQCTTTTMTLGGEEMPSSCAEGEDGEDVLSDDEEDEEDGEWEGEGEEEEGEKEL
ncbi:hypothetical protein ESCO_003402 [Escovopsis weberi]|uniref:Pathway-specific nitrogen regulator n=1 Tax=Escovopsis weberi TaxID=150374 RepID=A0A0M9VXK4_ESCWE|nr:hypothetical protein ESCO_003402 [Escovopsis weberi]